LTDVSQILPHLTLVATSMKFGGFGRNLARTWFAHKRHVVVLVIVWFGLVLEGYYLGL